MWGYWFYKVPGWLVLLCFKLLQNTGMTAHLNSKSNFYSDFSFIITVLHQGWTVFLLCYVSFPLELLYLATLS